VVSPPFSRREEHLDAVSGTIIRRSPRRGVGGNASLLARGNAALNMAPAERRALLRERLAAVENRAVIRPPFHVERCEDCSQMVPR
jgi:hypothetical protein